MVRLSTTSVVLLAGAIIILGGAVVYLCLIEPKKKNNQSGGQGNNPNIPPMNPPVMKPQLIMFYSNTCPACNAAKPEWQKVEQHLAQSPIQVLAIEANDPVAQGQGFKSVPTIRMYPQGLNGTYYDYTGPRQAEAIISWASQGLN